jgi:hypothetical protein
MRRRNFLPKTWFGRFVLAAVIAAGILLPKKCPEGARRVSSYFSLWPTDCGGITPAKWWGVSQCSKEETVAIKKCWCPGFQTHPGVDRPVSDHACRTMFEEV